MNSTDENIDYRQTESVRKVHSAVKREKEEPKVGLEPLSLMAFAGIALVLLAGGSFLGAYSGGFNFDIFTYGDYSPEPPEGAVVGAVAELTPPERGKRVYSTICQGCHQPNGMGVPGQYPPLAGSEYVTAGTERIAQIILNGLAGPVEVNGVTYGAQAMLAQKAILSDQKIADVMSYIRSEWGNGISEYVTKEMVAHARDAYGERASPYTVGELAPADAMLPGAAAAPEGGEESAVSEPSAEPSN